MIPRRDRGENRTWWKALQIHGPVATCKHRLRPVGPNGYQNFSKASREK